MDSNFKNDLSREILLGKHLDKIYNTIFSEYSVERIMDSDLQQKGVDLIISKEDRAFNIDEKAQLDYLEHDLPTFAFEISYLIDGKQKMGWLFDKNRSTDKYFAVTGIFCNSPNTIESGVKQCKLTSIDRSKLILLLKSKGLDFERVSRINQQIRNGSTEGRITIPELNTHTEGNFHFTKSGKAEQPINIVLKLYYLISVKAAKRIH